MDYVYVFIRTDIPVADQICQTAHACLAAGKQFLHPDHCNLVLLAVLDKQSLLGIAEKCTRNKIDHFVNFEPDDDMQETAIATAVIAGSTRRLFSSLPLWKLKAA